MKRDYRGLFVKTPPHYPPLTPPPKITFHVKARKENHEELRRLNVEAARRNVSKGIFGTFL